MKDDECCRGPCGGKGMMIVLAALLLAVGMMGGAYLLSKGDYAPKVDLSGFKSTPNVYVTPNPTEHAISVSASATKKVAPDLLEIQLRVQTESKNAKDSQDENARVKAILMEKLKALGVADTSIQTTSYNVEPVYDSHYTCDKDDMNCHWDSTLTGYQTVHVLNVDVEALDKGGAIVDAASEAGTNETFVDSTSYTLKEETKSEMAKTLLQEASAAAKAKAQRIADGLSVTLGKVLSASENSYYPTPYYNSYKSMDAAAAAAPTQLSPGQVDMSVSVSVSYEVGS